MSLRSQMIPDVRQIGRSPGGGGNESCKQICLIFLFRSLKHGSLRSQMIPDVRQIGRSQGGGSNVHCKQSGLTVSFRSLKQLYVFRSLFRSRKRYRYGLLYNQSFIPIPYASPR